LFTFNRYPHVHHPVPHRLLPTAAHALEYAIALAQKVGGKLLLLHAVPVPLQDPNTFFKASEVYSKDEAKAKLDALHGQIAARVPCESILKVGHSVTEPWT
jgi:nucleotide-binding universal stress UspA family protein